MNVREMRERFGLQAATGDKGLEREIRGGYCGDLLSEIMANAPQGCVWLTVQGHQNIVAVAVLREMAAVVLTGGRAPDEETVRKADQEGIPILIAAHSAYELAGRLHAAGVGNPDAA
ncbi:MAG: DRTGG domain-containing protein [Desulfobacterales bacterium]|jgi:predicted transcriptional regulator|nr:DRTGG domain-containing protein [Desulfobacterales bacterium]